MTDPLANLGPEHFNEFDPDYADIEVIEPVVVEEPDGFHTRRIVLDEMPVAGFLPAGATTPTASVAWHEEPLPEPIPRTRKVLRWVRTI